MKQLEYTVLDLLILLFICHINLKYILNTEKTRASKDILVYEPLDYEKNLLYFRNIGVTIFRHILSGLKFYCQRISTNK